MRVRHHRITELAIAFLILGSERHLRLNIDFKNTTPRITPMSVKIEFQLFTPPFRWDEAFGIRIGNSRVTLDSLLTTYHNGATPEEIAVQ